MQETKDRFETGGEYVHQYRVNVPAHGWQGPWLNVKKTAEGLADKLTRAFEGEAFAEVEERTLFGSLYQDVETLRTSVKAEIDSWLEGGNNAVALALEDVADALGMLLAQDRSRRDDQAEEGYCRHGVYVGGIGIDWMCGACESGEE